MNWKPVLWLSPFALGAGILSGALISAHTYRLRRRSIILTDKVHATEHTARQESAKQYGSETSDGYTSPFHSCTDYRALRILHISDTHLTHKQAGRQRFLSSLAAQQPDLIVFTGDLIGEDAAIDPLLEALSVFRGVPGVFVYGSNDYFAPAPRNPFKYFFKASSLSKKTPSRRLDTSRLTAGLEELGFLNLNNRTAKISLNDWEIEFIGVNDPHIGYAKFPDPDSFNTHLSQHTGNIVSDTSVTNRIRIGLTHAPYCQILNEMQTAGCRLVFAGHTHGGQICLPGQHALVTNCDLPPRYASGLFTWPIFSGKNITAGSGITAGNFPLRKNGCVAGWFNNTVADTPAGDPITDSKITESEPVSRETVHDRNTGDNTATGNTKEYGKQHVSQINTVTPTRKMFVQVSAGIGTSPFAQIRTFCPPEAIQIDIIRI